jgi:hypothetical protein
MSKQGILLCKNIIRSHFSKKKNKLFLTLHLVIRKKKLKRTIPPLWTTQMNQYRLVLH